MMLHVLLILAAIAKRLHATGSAYKVIEALLMDDSYDRNVRPGELLGTTTKVKLGIYINDISSFNAIDMDYTVDMFFRQEWHDQRLASPLIKAPVSLSHTLLGQLWTSDAYFINEKEAELHVTTVPNIMLMVEPDGTVFYSQRLTLKLVCVLSLEDYPFDDQTCTIDIESYGTTIEYLEFMWYEEGAVQNNTNLRLPEFDFTKADPKNCTKGYTKGTFSCMSVSLHFRRRIGYYLIHTYIPSTLIVILSWVAFWIDYKAVPARTSIGLLTVLTITTQSSGIGSTLPKVSYIKAIDVWMSTCLVFVFSALIEYSLVNVLARRQYHREQMQSVINVMRSQVLPGGKPPIPPPPTVSAKTQRSSEERATSGSKRCSDLEKYKNDPALFVDIVSRIFFPSAFVVFNLVYWLFYARD